MDIAFYVSNHGYGHATRIAALVEQLVKAGIKCYIITDRPIDIFEKIDNNNVLYRRHSLDFGMIQNSWVNTDIKQTKERLIELWELRQELIFSEVSFCRKNKIDCIVSDIPFFPFEVASELGIPSCGISNFDWCFIYDNVFLPEDKISENNAPGIQLTAFNTDIDLHFIVEQIRDYYQKADFAVRLPFSNYRSMSAFKKIIDGELLAAYYGEQQRQEFRQTINKDFRLRKDYPIILISFGGYGKHCINLPELYKTGKYIFSKDFGKYKHKNYSRCKLIPETYPYHKIMAAADIIITKTGYSTFAEVVKHQKMMIYTGRNGNPEDKILLETIKPYPLAHYIDLCEMEKTDWKSVISELEAKQTSISETGTASLPGTADNYAANDDYCYPALDTSFEKSNFNTAKTVLGGLLRSEYCGDEMHAVIDVGSNNVQLLWARIKPERIESIHRTIRTSALSKDMKDGILTSEGINRTKEILTDYIEMSLTFIDNITIIGTSCSREAVNIDTIKEWLAHKYQLNYRIISSDEEASLAGLANRIEFSEHSDVLFFDIGGGSTEFIAYIGEDEVFKQSINLGIRRLINESISGPFSKEEIIAERLAQINFRPGDKTVLIGIGGTVTNIAAVKKGLTHYDSEKVHRSILTLDDIEFYKNVFRRMSYQEIEDFMPFEPERADIIVTGLEIVGSILRYFGFQEILVSDFGIILGEAQRIRAKTSNTNRPLQDKF